MDAWVAGEVSPVLLACDLGDLAELRQHLAAPEAQARVSEGHAPNRRHGVKDGRRSGQGNVGSPAYNAGLTPLMAASRSGHLTVVQALLAEFGAEVAATDRENWNALHYACFSGHADVAALLVAHGCPRDVVSTFEKAVPVGFARHRRFAACCAACGDDAAALPAPFSLEERAEIAAKARGKLEAARRKKEPFLHRYGLQGREWAEVERFLDARGLEDLQHAAVDLLTGRRVELHWCGDHERHVAKAAAMRERGENVLRASSVSGIQHFIVTPSSSPEGVEW